ncbi:hypothetical protein METBIDRAFT_77163 [Metschnikowia bicuspidata var. bicuspidata NRRL YB-4993]|uniref:Nucleoporin Nup133/Nup155-like C-terminal domain-containing protein n=1 Tax=Metschnikowia bicuspidata var. bicuspidata NRRL YB-4993 TaxID=869754 RepID=A0A1A0HKE2_9ASCO|nr:hypothetical protein METBIDRAFT_77163 [Metschnikowia bicuspidata var. bicuspidata NRRL YB-4993]OBA24357.1 hypothetical protein METBIDRAFT_77163 [Metschnikowia bicuspidata var. bicuspidata NRRL YB-4993]
MPATSAGLFRPRKFAAPASPAAPAKLSFLADLTTDLAAPPGVPSAPSSGATELTKNDKYSVARLPAVPPVLGGHSLPSAAAAAALNAYTDNATRCALAVGENTINVWPYSSTDDTPLTFEFPLGTPAPSAGPLAILTRPAPGTTLDPGLAVIDSCSGHVCFYESVQYAPALGMIRSARSETTVALLAAQGEYITLAENVEPAGIAVATSWQRVVLVVLRDHSGAPHLSSVELTRPPASRRFAGWLRGAAPGELGDEIVAIRAGPPGLHGHGQQIVVLDAAGSFRSFVFLVSAAGMPFVDHRSTVLYALASHLERNVDGLIPGAVLASRFLDLQPLVQDNAAPHDVYVCLVAVRSSTHGLDAEQLLLLKLQINASGVLVLGSHQLPGVLPLLAALPAPSPRLYIPRPGRTAFVYVGNSVIMSDLSPATSATASQDFSYYEPQWEDVVNFKTAVQIIGCGYEDRRAAPENPALVLVTAGHGVVRIERFLEDPTGSTAMDTDPSDPVALLKSHINQAIFYGDSSLVNFDVDASFLLDTIDPAVRSVVSSILDSSSPYLPGNFSSTRDSFSLRLELLRRLIEYTRSNFSDSLYAVLPVMVEALEKLEVASNLWNIIDSHSAEVVDLKSILKRIITHNDLVQKALSQDTIRLFFANNVDEILPVLTELVAEISASNVSLKLLVMILVSTLHDAVHKNEVAYIFGNSEIPPFKLWLFDSSLLVEAEQIYTKAFCSKNEAFQFLDSSSSRNELIQFTETLYFLMTSAIQFMQQTNDDQLHEYLKWYNRRKGAWVDALISRGLIREALAISQKYHDFYSVAHILEKERDQMSPEYVFDKIDFFMNQYGYSFASKLFDFYILKKQFQRILVDCKPYETFLEQYFQENPKNSDEVSWIYYLQVRNFKEASNVLMSLSIDETTENQGVREFNFSMAKLCAIVAKSEGTIVEDGTGLDELAVDAENNLVAIRIQNQLHQKISSFVDNKRELITLEYFVANFLNPKLSRNEVETKISPFFQRFVDEKTLSKEELISLLTSINPTTHGFNQVFSDSLKIAALISNDSIFHKQACDIWKRLICSTDDWGLISATEGNSDEVNKSRVKGTVLFNTLKVVQEHKEIMSVLDDVLKKTHEDFIIEEGSWDEKLQQLVVECNIEMWISTVRNEAK